MKRITEKKKNMIWLEGQWTCIKTGLRQQKGQKLGSKQSTKNHNIRKPIRTKGMVGRRLPQCYNKDQRSGNEIREGFLPDNQKKTQKLGRIEERREIMDLAKHNKSGR